jgi:hypothetical protein
MAVVDQIREALPRSTEDRVQLVLCVTLSVWLVFDENLVGAMGWLSAFLGWLLAALRRDEIDDFKAVLRTSPR